MEGGDKGGGGEEGEVGRRFIWSILLFGLPFILFLQLLLCVCLFMLCSSSFYVYIIAGKAFSLCFCVNNFVLIVFPSEM